MSHFYGGVEGNRGPATRQGSKDSGLHAYAQSYDSRVSIDYGIHKPHGEEERNIAHLTIGSGYTTAYRSRSLSFHPDEVAAALDTNDPKVQRIWQRIQDEFAKLDAEAPKAIERVERKRARLMKQEEKARKLASEERIRIVRELSPAAKAWSERLIGVRWDHEGFLEQGDMYLFERANLRHEDRPFGGQRVLIDVRVGWATFPFDLIMGQWNLPDSPEDLGIQGEINDSGFGYVRMLDKPVAS